MLTLVRGTIQENLTEHNSLPEIQDELEKSIFAARDALKALPNEPSKDPQNEISNLLHGFVADLVKHIEGVADEDGLLQSIRPAQEKFRSAIRGTAPEFLPFEKRFAGKKKLGKAEFLRNEEGEEESDDESEDDLISPHSLERKRKPKLIYIDEVFERAHQ